MLAFAQCVRKHGVNIPDPTFGGPDPGPGAGAVGECSVAIPQSPVFQSAAKACGRPVGPRIVAGPLVTRSRHP
ncbi:MAG: hypothetical protein M3071_24985 [Actinomycetota bacterium]|nr:hypothetical protein [Actinomycetota bacterium]